MAGNRVGDTTEVVCLPPCTAHIVPRPQRMYQAFVLPHRSTSPAQCAKTNSSILMGATCPYGHEKVDMHLVSIPKGCKHH